MPIDEVDDNNKPNTRTLFNLYFPWKDCNFRFTITCCWRVILNCIRIEKCKKSFFISFFYFVLIYWKSDIVIVKCDFEQLIISGRLIFVFCCGYSRCVLLVTFRYFRFMILHYFCLISFCIFCLHSTNYHHLSKLRKKLQC